MVMRYRFLSREKAKKEDAPIGMDRAGRVIDYVHANAGANLSLVAMAEIAGVSPSHFVLVFTRATGLTPHQYVLRVRIERAKLQLENRTLSIAEVSRLSGFRTQEHFTKVFRKMVGVTPREFRSAMQREHGSMERDLNRKR
jgi:AraC family transcriptional regulator